MAKELYGRRAELIVGPKLREGDTSVPPDGLKFRTRLNFSIKKNVESAPNTARITIYNLSPPSRSFIQQFGEYKAVKKENDSSSAKTPGLIWLNVGYGNPDRLLFFGDLQRHKVERRGPDILLTIEADDGGVAITQTKLVLGLAENATNRQIFKAIADAMQLSLRIPVELPLKNYQKGYTFTGLAKDALTDVTKDQGLEWSVQNGELQVTKTGKDTGQEAVFLSVKTGLVGVPTRTSKGVQAQSLLNSRIQPGNPVKITSEELNEAVFKVTNVEHDGDSFSGEWRTDFEAVPVD